MVETVPQVFINTVQSYQKENLMLSKSEGKFVPVSTSEFEKNVKGLSLGLKELGLTSGDKLIILSENRPEWVMTNFANLCLGATTVPIYTTLSPEQIRYIVDDSDAKIVVCSNVEMWEKLAVIKDNLGKVTHFICFESDAPEGVLSFKDVIAAGNKRASDEPNLFENTALSVRPEDIASIIYTSGTTGVPKGVMLTHRNLISNMLAVCELIDFSSDDTSLSWLPLSHSFEHIVVVAYVYKGVSIGFAESVETVADNMRELRPHMMTSVPRLYEKIYSVIMESVLSGSGLKRKIFFWALKTGKKVGKLNLSGQKVPGFLEKKRKIAHKLVFSKIIAKTGGRVRIFISGAAPLSKDIAEFFHALGIIILEGYGLTETSPAITLNTFQHVKFGTVGRPVPGVEVKIAEDGEILAKGPNIMKGYFKKPEETAEVMDGEWFKTGDVGFIDTDGFITITDRKKDIIVTAGGKNVAPQQIENLLRASPFIINALAIGDRRKFVSALIVPDFNKVESYAKENNISFSSREELLNNEKILNKIEEEISKSTDELARYEKIKKFALLKRDFEIEKGELTPTLKVKRNIVAEKYKILIDSFYED
ncbi:MAG: long-chain fatty acid--CoA ligase [Candidatus Aminicenantes bacterium]|nr:long-chain fatty acid--CoA ligase [Candidatus Aminicenantes bacterium]